MIDSPNLDAIRERTDAARKMVYDLNNRRREWFLSIPVRRTYDPDTVICDALDDVPLLLSHIEAQAARITELEGVLAPFAEAAAALETDEWIKWTNDALLSNAMHLSNVTRPRLTVGHCRAAATVLARDEGEVDGH